MKEQFRRTAISAAIGILAVSCVTSRPWASSDNDTVRGGRTAQVERAVRDFLTTFENLDWERFRRSFTDDATVFFPSPEPPSRFAGRSEYEAQFKKVFANIKSSSTGGPPYHRLPPEELRIQVLSPDVAIASFLLRNDQRTARRTLVMRRVGDRWLITHLHASNVAR